MCILSGLAAILGAVGAWNHGLLRSFHTDMCVVVIVSVLTTFSLQTVRGTRAKNTELRQDYGTGAAWVRFVLFSASVLVPFSLFASSRVVKTSTLMDKAQIAQDLDVLVGEKAYVLPGVYAKFDSDRVIAFENLQLEIEVIRRHDLLPEDLVVDIEEKVNRDLHCRESRLGDGAQDTADCDMSVHELMLLVRLLTYSFDDDVYLEKLERLLLVGAAQGWSVPPTSRLDSNLQKTVSETRVAGANASAWNRIFEMAALISLFTFLGIPGHGGTRELTNDTSYLAAVAVFMGAAALVIFFLVETPGGVAKMLGEYVGLGGALTVGVSCLIVITMAACSGLARRRTLGREFSVAFGVCGLPLLCYVAVSLIAGQFSVSADSPWISAVPLLVVVFLGRPAELLFRKFERLPSEG